MARTEHPPRHEGGPGNSRHLDARRQGRDMHACASPHPFVSPARQVGSAHPPDRAHALPHRPVGYVGVPGMAPEPRRGRGIRRARARAARLFAASGPGDRESPTAQPVAAPAPNPQPRLAVPAASLEGCCRRWLPSSCAAQGILGKARWGVSLRAARESPSRRVPERLGSSLQRGRRAAGSSHRTSRPSQQPGGGWAGLHSKRSRALGTGHLPAR